MSTGFQEYAFSLQPGRRVRESRKVWDPPDTNRKKTVFKFFAAVTS
jgi:hypothetical protein